MRRRRSRWSAWFVCLTLGAPSALAQSRVTVPDGCGNEDEYYSEIERLTGASASAASAATVSIEPLAEGGYELRLTLGSEQRTLRDPDCRVLWRSALVIVAAASRSGAETEPPAAPPAAAELPVPAPPPAPPPQVTTPPAQAAPSAPARTLAPATTEVQPSRQARPRSARRTRGTRGAVTRPRQQSSASVTNARSVPELDNALNPDLAGTGPSWGLAVGAGVSGGVVPGLGPALELGGHLEVLPWALALSFRYWPERSESVGARGVDVSALGGRAALLFRLAPALNVLAGLELMRLVGTGAPGVSGRNEDAAWQLAPTLGLNLITWDIEYLRIEVGVAGRVSLLRPRFVVTGFGDLYRAPALGGDAIIRGVWLFQ